MHRARRLVKPVFALVVLAAVALIAAGCAFVKPGSLTASQPAGIGAVRVHFEFCTIGEGEQFCGASEDDEARQYLAGIAVPPGSTPPATFTATPTAGGTPVVFTRSDEVAAEMAASSVAIQNSIAGLSPKEKEEFEAAKEIIGSAWPPSGLQGVGYLSAPIQESKGKATQWSIDADFGLPAGANGGPFPGPFVAAIAWGSRDVEVAPATRPVHCVRLEEGTTFEATDAICSGTIQQVQPGVADLKVTTPKKVGEAFVGGSGEVAFPLNFGGTVAANPSFKITATTSAKGGKAQPGPASFTPGALNSSTHLAPTATNKVKVSVPKSTKPGTYTVTLTATTPQGGTATGAGKLKVTKPKLKFGPTKFDAAKGTATLKVKVPGAGKLTVSGKGIKKAKKKAKKKGTLKVKIKATGSTAAFLATTGSAKVKLKVAFKPTSGISVTKKKSVVLKLK